MITGNSTITGGSSQLIFYSIPDTPIILSVTNITSSSAKINITPPPASVNVLGYNVFNNGLPFGSYTGTSSITLTSLIPTTNYSITLIAYNSYATSNISSAITFTTSDLYALVSNYSNYLKFNIADLSGAQREGVPIYDYGTNSYNASLQYYNSNINSGASISSTTFYSGTGSLRLPNTTTAGVCKFGLPSNFSSTAYSFCCWIDISSTFTGGGNFDVLFSLREQNSFPQYWPNGNTVLYMSSTGLKGAAFTVQSASSSSTVLYTGVFSHTTSFSFSTTTYGTWYYLCITYSNGTHTMYVNGLPVSTLTGLTNNTWTPVFGGIGGTYSMPANIDEALLYNTKLSDSDILKNYNYYLNQSMTTILAYTTFILHLDAAASSNFTFSSGNNISSWNDIAGNYNFTSIGGNGTTNSYATWDSTLKAVQFGLNGYGQYTGYPSSSNPAVLYNTTTSTTPITLANGGTFYCVLQVQPNSTWANGPFEIGSQTGNGNLYGYTNGSTMYIDTLGNSRAGPITISPTNGGQSFYTKSIYKVTVTTGNVFTYQYITSTNRVSTTYGGGTRGISLPMVLGAGGNSNGSFNNFQGYIYEVMLFNTLLSLYDQNCIESYLINKWSL